MAFMDNGFDVGSQIRELVNELEAADPDAGMAALVKSAWAAAVDPRVQQHVTGVYVIPDSGARAVIVYVDSPLWSTELNMQRELLRLKLNMKINELRGIDPSEQDSSVVVEQILKLKITVSKRQYARREVRMTTYDLLQEGDRQLEEIDPVPLEADEEQVLKSTVDRVENPDLAKIAYEAAKSSIEWQKGLSSADEAV